MPRFTFALILSGCLPTNVQLEDNCTQNCHWGGKSSVLWSEILFYGDALAEPYNAICDHNNDD